MKNLKKVYKFNINHSVIRQLSTPAYSGISLTPNSNTNVEPVQGTGREKANLILGSKDLKGRTRTRVPYVAGKVAFKANLANSQSLSYSFTDNVRLTLNHKQKLASELLSSSFLNIGCLISKPAFKLLWKTNSIVNHSSPSTNTSAPLILSRTSALKGPHKGGVVGGQAPKSRGVDKDFFSDYIFLIEKRQELLGFNSSTQTNFLQLAHTSVRSTDEGGVPVPANSDLNLPQPIQPLPQVNLNKKPQKWVIRLFFYIRNPFLFNPYILPGIAKVSNNSWSSTPTLKGHGTGRGETSSIQTQSMPNILFLDRYKDNITYLVKELNNIFKADIELELIQLKKPYHSSNILAQHLNLRSYKYRFVKLINKFLRKFSFVQSRLPSTLLPILLGKGNIDNLYTSKISGVKIKLGGRTFKQKVIPRRTVQQIQRGSLARDKVQLIEKSRITGKTRRGAYSFTVTLGHVLV